MERTLYEVFADMKRYGHFAKKIKTIILRDLY